MTTHGETPSWTTARLDLLAFALGLGVAWYSNWTTTDLVWSLWLSSLVVGYATVLWGLLLPVLGARRRLRRARAGSRVLTGDYLGARMELGTASFLLMFFSVHFLVFHYTHSQFLAMFFPVVGTPVEYGDVGIGTYLEVARRYWMFLPAALLAERALFVRKEPAERPVEPEASSMVRLRSTPAVAAISRHTMGPYRNIVRMHLLIFFFAAASHFELEHFGVYAVVYAAYFFPWRLVRRARVEHVVGSRAAHRHQASPGKLRDLGSPFP